VIFGKVCHKKHTLMCRLVKYLSVKSTRLQVDLVKIQDKKHTHMDW